jgi:ribonuclease P protein component
MSSFRKEERLCDRSIIAQLFKKGSNFTVYPLRVNWLFTSLPPAYPAQVLIAVNKKALRKAIDRNAAKRLIREAYRNNKTIIYNTLIKMRKQCALSLVYVGDKRVSYKEIETIIIVILRRLVSEYESSAE